LIREEKLQQIYSSMQAGQKESNMQTMTQDLARLVKNDIIDMNEALNQVPFMDEFQSILAKSQPVRR
ncbi:MAG TPA: type IV pili twitching motility protein PilT, partial [bacterium]|nr:type IV pili twitching motility protein PilT [bacterium]